MEKFNELKEEIQKHLDCTYQNWFFGAGISCQSNIPLMIPLTKKIKEIKKNPEHYKPLKNVLKGNRRAHLDPFIIIFNIEANLITFHYVKHHDQAY